MFRAALLYLSSASWARRLVTGWGFARRAASRFIAGDTLAKALEVIQRLNNNGLFTTLDHLGENVTKPEEAVRATDEYIEVLEQIDDTGVKSNISLKLTQLGMGLDFELCLENMQCIAARAAEFGIMVRIDMEDSSTVDRTIDIFRQLRQAGSTNVGLVFQSYLYRTEKDLQAVLNEGASVRLCKGAYKEPPDVAFPRKADVDANFDKLTALLIDVAMATGSIPASPDGKVPPVTAIATHDEKRIAFAKSYAADTGFSMNALEFQMLNGIRSDLQTQLASEGYPVRVYVPFGTEWYPYYVRRLAEHPANVYFFLSNLLRR
ncbi:MAG: proline dehydrogenase [Anaerolineales bacterium]|nr:proline dehydrogenase [Anaerolineales bacterium]